MIEHRRDGLSQVSNVMSGLKDLGVEFNAEVEKQGDLLINVGQELEDANINTRKGVNELNQYAEKIKGKGTKMLFCLGVLILILLFLIYLIFM